MSDFEAGALVWKLRTVGKSVFDSDMRDAQTAFTKTGDAAKKAAADVDGQGTATERTGRKARDAKAPLEEQATSTRKVGDESDKASRKQQTQADVTEKQRAAAKELSVALLAAGVAAGAMVSLSIAKYSEFSAQMSNTGAATKATAAEQRELADAALDAGADTAYSATEAAAAQEELAKAGQSVSDIVDGSLTGSLALAAAGQLEVARSAEIMATVLTQFRLPAEQAGHVADVLAAGAGKAQGSVDDLSLALSYVGPLANSMGWSLEQTAGVIAYFSTQGIVGEKAGTALRGVLASLQAPSGAAAKVMEEYGISVYDANGRMLEAAPLAQELKNKLGGLTDQERQAALGRIFGNESLLAATLLYEGGAQAVSTWTDNVNDASYAADQAAQRQDNLAGDVEKLGGAFDTALIKTGSGANDVLREMVQTLTGMVDLFGDAPEPVQETALVLGTATTAAALLAGATLGVQTKWAEWKETLGATNAQMGRSALAAGVVGVALTGVLVVVAALAQQQAEARQRAQSYADALDQGAEATRKFVVESLVAERTHLWISRGSAADAAAKFGISLETIADAAQGNAEALKLVQDVLRAGEGDTQVAAELADRFGLSLIEVSSASTTASEGIRQMQQAEQDGKHIREQINSATDENISKTKTAGKAYLDAADGAKSMQDELSRLLDLINRSNDANANAITSSNAYRDTLAKIDEVIQKARDGVDENQDGVADYTASLDENTQAGRDNMSMLVDLASDTRQMATDHLTATGNVEEFQQKLQEGRDNLIQRAQDLGYSADEARRLADEIISIPTKPEVEVIVKTQQAMDQAAAFKALWESIRSRTVTLDAVPLIGGGQVQRSGPLAGGYQFAEADGGVVSYYARGAVLSGAGSEHHVAQMAKAGSYRVWAEPETGGETYVPHAESKRARSEAIMAETAAIFGGMYIPAAALAGGAAVPQSAGGGAPIVNIAAINIPPGVTYAEAVSIAKEAVVDGLHAVIPPIGY
ncbi:phage tail tape measure protein [Microbacterium sp. BWR-S6Y]|uniref:phage tail tape measure protein n=1 Tax=Microbacterium sp. BWR-S6Y TaxID=3232073 RepID=UPI0035289029